MVPGLYPVPYRQFHGKRVDALTPNGDLTIDAIFNTQDIHKNAVVQIFGRWYGEGPEILVRFEYDKKSEVPEIRGEKDRITPAGGFHVYRNELPNIVFRAVKTIGLGLAELLNEGVLDDFEDRVNFVKGYHANASKGMSENIAAAERYLIGVHLVTLEEEVANDPVRLHSALKRLGGNYADAFSLAEKPGQTYDIDQQSRARICLAKQKAMEIGSTLIVPVMVEKKWAYVPL
jgi:hypothetical protein